MSDNKTLANRRNALLSSGPKTPTGRTRSSKNALAHGLYTAAVVPSVGESPETLAALCARVRRELQPRGAVAERLVERVALILLRLDRVTRYEAAAAGAVDPRSLPPDPDTVTGAGVDVCRPAPGPDAPPAVRLAYARARLEGWEPAREACVAAVAALGGGGGADPLSLPGAFPVRREIEDALGWTWEESHQKWRAAARDGSPGAAGFRRLVARLAREAGRPARALVRSLRERLAARATEYDQPIAEVTAEAGRLATAMRAARERAAAAAVYADGEAVDRVVRVEAHLTRQLRLTLDELDRLRGADTDEAGGLGVLVRGVLAGAPRALPVGSFRNGEGGEEPEGAPSVVSLRGSG